VTKVFTGATSKSTGRNHGRKRQFCSRTCCNDYRRRTAAEHPLSRGGRYRVYGPNWQEQARRARARDADTCQDCGVTRPAPALDVHHLVSRRQFGTDYEAMNRLENLITLCEACHRRWEHATRRRPIVPH